MAGQTPTPAQVAAGQARAGGTAPVVATTAKPKKKKTKSIADVASGAAVNAGAGAPQGTTPSTQLGLDGRPIRSKIVSEVQAWKAPLLPGYEPSVVKYTQYYKGSGRNWFLTLKNQERADYLAMLSQIPGLYKKNEALKATDLQRLAASSTMIPPRPEDITAIEKVMLYADTVGTDVQEAIKYLFKNPSTAQTYFDVSEINKGAKKVSLTPSDILGLELSQYFQDFLDAKVDKDTVAQYVEKVNAIEIARGGNALQVERQNIMLDLVQQKAQQIIKSDAPDNLLMQRGALGGAYNALRKAYREYGVSVDDKTVYRQAIDSIRSQQAFENTIQKIQTQAQVAFPALEKYYAQGLSTREALANYIGLKAKMYNIPEMDIKIDDIYPAIKGKELMTMDEWKKYLYSLPEFTKTDLYRQRSFSDAQVLMRNFFGGAA
jgi:hypothetical protein